MISTREIDVCSVTLLWMQNSPISHITVKEDGIPTIKTIMNADLSTTGHFKLLRFVTNMRPLHTGCLEKQRSLGFEQHCLNQEY